MQIALTRKVSPNFDRCELTHIDRFPIDVALAERQHAQYEVALISLGVTVIGLLPDPELPDSIFIEDTALVFDEIAVITRPGAASRRPETSAVSAALAPYREVVSIVPPGIMDGGDVLQLDRRVFVGESIRTNAAAIQQLEAHLSPWDYRVTAVPVTGCLHLKSAVTQVGEKSLLLNRSWVDEAFFPGWDLLEVDPEEPGAANALFLDGGVIFPAAYPKTLARLARAGIPLLEVDVSEVLKAEGGVTCCSLIFQGGMISSNSSGL